MKDIQQLIPDIYNLISSKDGWFTDELAKFYSDNLAVRLQDHLNEEQQARLRLSGLGPKCPRELWYSINQPELAEPLPPWANIKYSYGHMVEAFVLMLAKAAGHSVEGCQDELWVDGIRGHRDAVIDGCIVDVKSCNSLSFDKFKTGRIKEDDPFGYLLQLDGYGLASLDDPLVLDKEKSYILAVDLVKGHLYLYQHLNRYDKIRKQIALYKEIVDLPEPPACTCEVVPDGKSGNMKLGVKASYSRFKYQCFPHLRCFLYSDGPRYLTKVVRLPEVTEVTRDGTYIQPQTNDA